VQAQAQKTQIQREHPLLNRGRGSNYFDSSSQSPGFQQAFKIVRPPALTQRGRHIQKLFIALQVLFLLQKENKCFGHEHSQLFGFCYAYAGKLPSNFLHCHQIP